MNKLMFSILTLTALVTCSAVEPGSFEEKAAQFKWACIPQEGLPNVLLLGDSISIGYTLFVRESLADKANVYRPILAEGKKPENCGSAVGAANKKIDRWLKVQNVKKWDVIHFNWGLHDLKRIKPGMGVKSNDPSVPSMSSIKDYKSSLTLIVKKLKKTGAKLIFATTTPYPAGVTPCRLPEDAVLYNKAALEVMKEFNVEVNDLYKAVLPKLKEYQIPVNVHFNSNGSKYLAEEISELIKKKL
ncbi:MAG: SGNH/GDSL hydrolase family protein [Lentisphaeraceae bacterium]|nr:SGNH/GDSL hydrolase family protein [Lentisphaeraceae bacterium]